MAILVTSGLDKGLMDDTATNTRDAELIRLLARIAESDQTAFQQLYDIVSPIIFGVLLRMHRSSSQAEDSLQETFVRIWENAGSYNSRQGRPLTWMISIARYHALDALRAQTSRLTREREYAAELERCSSSLARLETAHADGQLLSICLERLEPKARDCVVHAYCGGYSHQELSALTGHALGTVKSWIRRSLNALRECINEFA